jgi:transposase
MQAHVVDAAPLIRGLCDQLELVRIIDDMTEWDDHRAKLSPGQRIQALILGMFMRQRPLYRVHESFRRTDVELLLGRGITLDDLNDDAFGHALDKLYDAGAGAVFSALCARVAVLEDVRRDFLHWDSTTRSVFGAYEQPSDEDAVHVTYGHSKAHRPDLKQIVLTLLANREGMPLWGTVENGNASDKKLNGEVLDQIRAAFSAAEIRSLTYVADSAFATKENLAKAAKIGLGFLTRLPETFSAGPQAKAKAWAEDRWVAIGKVAERREATTYQASEQEGEIGERRYRLVVYRSAQLEKRKEKALERDLVAEREELEAEAGRVTRHPFICREDAESQARAFVKVHADAFHAIEWEIVEEVVRDKRSGPGRPRRDEEPTYHTDYRLHLRVGARKDEAIRQERERRSAFVLVTTMSREQADARELLMEYKQQGSIERRFAFMKDPEVVDSFFVKKPERVEALGYVLLMVCLLFSVLERRVRQTGRPLPTLSRKDVRNPTGLEILRNLSVSVIELDDGRRHLSVHTGFGPVFQAIMEMARVDVRVYTEVPRRSTA